MSEETPDEEPAATGEEETGPGFEAMTIAQLRDYAAAQDPPVDLNGLTLKSSIIAALDAALAESP